METTYILETERLRLREFTLNDTDFLIRLLNSEGWLKNIGDRNVRTKQEAESYIQSVFLDCYKTKGYGFWLVEEKQTNESIGMCGITKRGFLALPDLGYAFLPEFHAQGFAFEMAKAVKKYVETDLSISELCAITITENTASIRLLEKLGFQFQETIAAEHKTEKLLLFVFQLPDN